MAGVFSAARTSRSATQAVLNSLVRRDLGETAAAWQVPLIVIVDWSRRLSRRAEQDYVSSSIISDHWWLAHHITAL